jgi:hypothetical protein
MSVFDLFLFGTILFVVSLPWFPKPFLSVIRDFLVATNFLFFRIFVQKPRKFGTIRKWQGGNAHEPRQRNFEQPSDLDRGR